MNLQNLTHVFKGQTGEKHPAWKGGRTAACKRYYQRHKNDWREWRASNPEKVRRNSFVYVRNRIARKRGAVGTFSKENWLLEVGYYGWRCFYCHIGLTIKTLTADHRKPLSRNGSNWLSNLVPACRSCNSRKYTS